MGLFWCLLSHMFPWGFICFAIIDYGQLILLEIVSIKTL